VNPSLRGIHWSYGQWGGSLLASALENNGRNLWYSGGIISEMLFASLFWSSTLLISYRDITWICSQLHLAWQVSGIDPIIVILRGVVLMARGSGGSLLVPWTVTALSLQYARQY
jgi:hypothetical protein